jgi:hypothetical protein
LALHAITTGTLREHNGNLWSRKKYEKWMSAKHETKENGEGKTYIE